MDEQSFQESLKRIRTSATRDDLVAATQKSLRSLLRQPADQELLQSLLAQADSLTRSLPDGRGGAQSPEVRQAAVRCVVLLERAQKGRPLKKNRRVLILAVVAAAVVGLYIFLLR